MVLVRSSKTSHVVLNLISLSLHGRYPCGEFPKVLIRWSQIFDHNFYSKMLFRAQSLPPRVYTGDFRAFMIFGPFDIVTDCVRLYVSDGGQGRGSIVQ